MAQVLPYYNFVQTFASLTQDEFLARVTEPHLYFANLPELEETDNFKTIRLTPGKNAPHDLGKQGILTVKKATGSNAFGMMITMGRAKNNDLVIPDQRMSKFHCYFRRLGEQWSLTDANSTNGTVVDGKTVPGERSLPLRSGSKIELSGAIDVLFLLPADLFVMLQESRSWA